MDQRCLRVLVWRIGAWECLRWRGIPAVGARDADAAGGGHPREPVEAIRWPSSVLSSTVPCAQKKPASAGAVLVLCWLRRGCLRSRLETRAIGDVEKQGSRPPEAKTDSSPPLALVVRAGAL